MAHESAASNDDPRLAGRPSVAVTGPDGKVRRQCVATSHSTGERCQRPPIKGATVCRFHGGAAPQVKKAAQLRLLELVEPAIATLAREMVRAEKSADRQRAANSILDRAGVPRSVQAADPEAARELLILKLRELRERPPTPQVEAPAPAPDPETITLNPEEYE